MTSDAPVGIAGVKGGKSALINENTKNIIIEGANFNPVVTRRSSQSLKLQTDASQRFENDLPQELTAYGVVACVRLIEEISGGTCVGYVDEYPVRKENSEIVVKKESLGSILGLDIPENNVESILTRLSFSVMKNADGWTVVAPFERTDVIIPEDVIAEIGRVYGYEHVQSEVPKTVPLSELNIRHYYSEAIRDVLVAEGFSEVITSSFRKKDTIELANALASDKGCLRSTLRENIRETLDRNMPNLDLLGLRMLQVFEIGTVFSKTHDGKGIKEHTELALGVRVKQGGYTAKDDVRGKEILEKLEAQLGVPCGAAIDAGVLTVNLTELLPKLPKPSTYAAFRGASEVTFIPYSPYPFVTRDIALWAEEGTTAESIDALITETAGPLLFRTTLFDEFHKDGKVSYAFRLVFLSFDRTLTDEEVGGIMESIGKTLVVKGCVVR